MAGDPMTQAAPSDERIARQKTDATPATLDPSRRSPDLERRGRAWLLWGFLLCPCHLPLTLGVLAAVAGGTTLGGALRDNAVAAGIVITVTWLAATGYGLSLIRRADRSGGACPIPDR